MRINPKNPKTLAGDQVIGEMRKQTDTVLLAFSTGKDAVGAWLACRPHFARIVPYYMYLVPGLEFVERSLQYYEKAFGQRILRVPHPSLYRWLNNGIFVGPDQIETIVQANLPSFEYLDMQDEIRRDAGLSPDCYTASGVRAADSPLRRISIVTHGAISHKKQQFMPIWDWKIDQLLGEIRSAGMLLSVDYRMFGRSFDGLDYRFTEPIKRHFPRDYAKICEWFPLVEAEIKRREFSHAH